MMERCLYKTGFLTCLMLRLHQVPSDLFSRFVAFSHGGSRPVTFGGLAFYYGLTQRAQSGTKYKGKAWQRNLYSCLSCEKINRSRL